MSRLFSTKSIRWILTIILLISLLPLLWISFYSFPMADDFSFSAPIRNAWLENRNPLAVISALWNTIIDYYLHWQGTYTATLLGSIQPGLLGEHMYFLTTWIMLTLTVAATFLFVRSVFRYILKESSNDISIITSCVVLLISIQWVPSPVQAFFWWDGSIAYWGIQMLFLFLLAGIVSCIGKDTASILSTSLMAIGAFLIGGGNYITALLQFELLFLCLLYALWKKKNCRHAILIILLFALTGLLINILCPGNRYRQASYSGMGLFPSLAASFSTAFRDCLLWFPRIAVGLLFLLPFFWKLPRPQTNIKAWMLPGAILISYCLQASMYEPTFFAIGIKGEQRIDNIRFFMFVLHCVLWLYLSIQLIRERWEKQHNSSKLTNHSKQWIRFVAIISAVVILLTGILSIYEFKTHRIMFSSASALISLVKGKAQEYRRVSYERLAIFENDEPNVVIPVYNDPPYVLMWADATDDPTYWVNTTLAEYYGKESIVAH